MRGCHVACALVLALLLAGCGVLKPAGQKLRAEPPVTVPVGTEPTTAQPGGTEQVADQNQPTDIGPTHSDVPTKPIEATPEDPLKAVPGFYPAGTRTGIAVVDALVDAVEGGLYEGLLNDYQTLTRPCAPQPGWGAPVCPEGTVPSTNVTAYPYAWCDLAFHTDPQDMQLYLESALSSDRNLFAIYQPGVVPGLGVTADYAIVFGEGLNDYSAPTVYLDGQGRILLLRWGCGRPSLAVPEGVPVVLAPLVSPGEQRSEATAALTAHVGGEVQQLHRGLRIALGEYDPCEGSTGPCLGGEDFAGPVEGAIMRCEKVGPEAQMSGYGYDAERLDPLLKPYQAACNTLRSAKIRLGQPAETPEWTAEALAARELLEPALEYLQEP